MRIYHTPHRRRVRTYPTYKMSSTSRMKIKFLKQTSYDMVRVVQFLIDTIPSDTWEEIEAAIHESKDMWYIDMHFGFGMYVRNLIYQSGIPVPLFGLDEYWDVFLKKALQKRRIIMKMATLEQFSHPIE